MQKTLALSGLVSFTVLMGAFAVVFAEWRLYRRASRWWVY